MKNKIFCKNCGQEMFFAIDEWGHTPFHLHCNNCGINIGSISIEKALELYEKYNDKNTYIEYYKKEIQLYIKGDEVIIDNEKRFSR